MTKFFQSLSTIGEGYKIGTIKADIAELNQRLKTASEEEQKALKEELNKLESQLTEISSKQESDRKEANDKEKEKLGNDLNGDLEKLIEDLEERGISYSICRKGGMVGVSFASDKNGNPIDREKVLQEIGEKFGSEIAKAWKESFSNEKPIEKLADIWDRNFGEKKNFSLDSSKNAPSTKDFDHLNENPAETAKSFAKIISSENSGSSIGREWYDDSRLMRSAAASIDEEKQKDVELCGAIPIGDHLPKEISQEILSSRIESAQKSAESGKTCLMAFQVNDNHWVGGALAKDGEGKMTFLHNDPFGNEIDGGLKEALEKKGIGVIDLQIKQQKDGHNCGPYTADNLAKFAETFAESKQSGNEVRAPILNAENGEKLREQQDKALDISHDNQAGRTR